VAPGGTAADDVRGGPPARGRFLANEAPGETYAELRAFFTED